MYALVRLFIDDTLMGPTLGPFTTFAVVLVLAVTAIVLLSPDGEA